VKQVCSVVAKMCHFHSLRALLQPAEGHCLLKSWDANCKYNLIYRQAAGLVCNKTAEFPCEVQTCNWTEGHAVVLNVENEAEAAEVVAIVQWQYSEACCKRFRDS
jgi:hypothetical protein